jgi:TRAP-type mannitol/chloroaromatic compound transport system permease large subunit
MNSDRLVEPSSVMERLSRWYGRCRTGLDAQHRLCRLHHRSGQDAAGSCACHTDRKKNRLGALRVAVALRRAPASIFVVVVGAMSAGIATPTESAALGALATMALAAGYRVLNFKNLLQALRGTVAISGMILFIILSATTFSQILSFSGATQGIVSAILGQGLSAFAILTGMMLLLIFLGIFVDQVSMMLITLPVFMPIVQRLDIDLIWFGVLYLICMQLGLLLPPHGLLLMTMKGVAPPEVTMAHIFERWCLTSR